LRQHFAEILAIARIRVVEVVMPDLIINDGDEDILQQDENAEPDDMPEMDEEDDE